MSEPRKTPWILSVRNASRVVDANGTVIAITGHSLGAEEGRVNAALIVKAVNAYGPLVEALRNVRAVGSGNAHEIADQALKDIGEDTPEKCERCKGTGTIDTPYSGSDPSCPDCDGEGIKS